jgi:hypothetical protein
MKKIKIFLILFTLLTFSNTAFAGFFGDIFDDFFGIRDVKSWNEASGSVNSVRCKVEYTQLDLNTGIEKVVKHTSQQQTSFNYMPAGQNTCYLSTQDLTEKMNAWLNKSSSNIITNMTVINCKSRRLYSSKFTLRFVENRWDEYKSCDDEFNANLIDWLDRPQQWGFNVHKERLIRDYEDGFENYEG